jgi:hypothetical protein
MDYVVDMEFKPSRASSFKLVKQTSQSNGLVSVFMPQVTCASTTCLVICMGYIIYQYEKPTLFHIEAIKGN